MKKIVRLTERDLTRLVKKVIKEDKETFRETFDDYGSEIMDIFHSFVFGIKDMVTQYEEELTKLAEEISDSEVDGKLNEDEVDELLYAIKQAMDDIREVKKIADKL